MLDKNFNAKELAIVTNNTLAARKLVEDQRMYDNYKSTFDAFFKHAEDGKNSVTFHINKKDERWFINFANERGFKISNITASADMLECCISWSLY